MPPPHDTPLIMMQSAVACGCEDLYPTMCPIFLRDDEFKAKVVMLHSVGEGVGIIRSVGDGQELIVGTNGGCYFESPVLGISEEFNVEVVANGSMVFVSTRTGNVLASDDSGLPRCVDTIRCGWFLLQYGGTGDNPVVEAAPISDAPCDRYQHDEAKERREYIMKLVSLGKSLEEIDAILLRMYAWPTAEKVIVASRGTVSVECGAPP